MFRVRPPAGKFAIFPCTIPQSPQSGDSSLYTREPLHKGAFGHILLRVKSLPCVRGGGSPTGDPEGLREKCFGLCRRGLPLPVPKPIDILCANDQRGNPCHCAQNLCHCSISPRGTGKPVPYGGKSKVRTACRGEWDEFWGTVCDFRFTTRLRCAKMCIYNEISAILIRETLNQSSAVGRIRASEKILGGNYYGKFL